MYAFEYNGSNTCIFLLFVYNLHLSGIRNILDQVMNDLVCTAFVSVVMGMGLIMSVY